MTKARDIASAAPAPSTVSATELGYLDGVSSAIQTQIDGKSSTAHNHDSAYLNQSVIDAKGDLLVGTADNAYGRLAVSDNGSTLVADSSTSTGLRYTAGNAIGNPVLNSAFQIWQRGTSFTTSGGYTADRWYSANNANTTYSRQTTSDTTNLPNIQYSLRMQRTAGATSTDGSNIIQNFETINSIPYAGKMVTLSFYARKGADLSGNFNAYLASGTGTDQSLWSGFTGAAYVINVQPTLTTTWARYSYTGTIATTTTQLAIQFNKGNSGTAGAADWVEVTGVQIDVGSVALPFRTYSATLAGELLAAQRYYFRTTVGSGASVGPIGNAYSTTGIVFRYRLPATMRVTPTSIDYNTLKVGDDVNAQINLTSLTLDGNSTPDLGQVLAAVSSGLTQYRSYAMNGQGAGSYLGFSAEL